MLFREKPGFGKEVGFAQIYPNRGGLYQISPHYMMITCTYFILTTSEICQTEGAIKVEASVITHDARVLHRLQLPPMLRTFPSTGLEVVKKSLWIYAWHFKRQLFRYEPSKCSDNLRCAFLVWIGQLPARSCKTTSGTLKLDVAAVNSQRQRNNILSTG